MTIHLCKHFKQRTFNWVSPQKRPMWKLYPIYHQVVGVLPQPDKLQKLTLPQICFSFKKVVVLAQTTMSGKTVTTNRNNSTTWSSLVWNQTWLRTFNLKLAWWIKSYSCCTGSNYIVIFCLWCLISQDNIYKSKMCSREELIFLSNWRFRFKSYNTRKRSSKTLPFLSSSYIAFCYLKCLRFLSNIYLVSKYSAE